LSEIAYLITIILFAGALVYEKHLNHKKNSELLDRLQAKSLEEFNYETKIRPVELDHNKKALEIQREEMRKKIEEDRNMSHEERDLRAAAGEF
jgi:hypothetical protein